MWEVGFSNPPYISLSSVKVHIPKNAVTHVNQCHRSYIYRYDIILAKWLSIHSRDVTLSRIDQTAKDYEMSRKIVIFHWKSLNGRLQQSIWWKNILHNTIGENRSNTDHNLFFFKTFAQLWSMHRDFFRLPQ